MNSNSRQAVLDMLLLCYENNTETKLKIKNNFILIKKKKKKKGRIKLFQVAVLLQKLTLTIRVYQKLKRHKPIHIRANQGRAKLSPLQETCSPTYSPPGCGVPQSSLRQKSLHVFLMLGAFS